MTDDKRKRGRQDRAKIACNDDSEVGYVAKKFGITRRSVRSAIKRVGNSRRKVYADLRARA